MYVYCIYIYIYIFEFLTIQDWTYANFISISNPSTTCKLDTLWGIYYRPCSSLTTLNYLNSYLSTSLFEQLTEQRTFWASCIYVHIGLLSPTMIVHGNQIIPSMPSFFRVGHKNSNRKRGLRSIAIMTGGNEATANDVLTMIMTGFDLIRFARLA